MLPLSQSRRLVLALILLIVGMCVVSAFLAPFQATSSLQAMMVGFVSASSTAEGHTAEGPANESSPLNGSLGSGSNAGKMDDSSSPAHDAKGGSASGPGGLSSSSRGLKSSAAPNTSSSHQQTYADAHASYSAATPISPFLTTRPVVEATARPKKNRTMSIAILTYCDIVAPDKRYWLRAGKKKKKPLPDVNGQTGASKSYFMPVLAKSNHLAYARRHDYAIHQEFDLPPELKDKMIGHHGSPHWAKPLLLLHFLPKYDVIFWIDTDALFMNFSIEVESLVDMSYDAVFASDNNGLNNGVGIYRNTANTRDMLQGLWDVPPAHIGGAYDNSALWYVLRRSKPYLSSRVKMVPRFRLNAFPPEALSRGHGLEPGLYKVSDFVVHFPGRRVSKSIAQKYFCFSNRINNVSQEELAETRQPAPLEDSSTKYAATAAGQDDGGASSGAGRGEATAAEEQFVLPSCADVLGHDEVLGERVADWSILNYFRDWR